MKDTVKRTWNYQVETLNRMSWASLIAVLIAAAAITAAVAPALCNAAWR